MKLTKYITTACIAALFTGCDYLDFDETTGMTKEEMYSYFGNVTSLSTFVYTVRPVFRQVSCSSFNIVRPVL